ncbi:hypothetical protein F5X96DRAFT_652483 [Biscogniauxia mediterranea]|nr:hypothetical protein F5X96DRAFT_652483 [Biscogniauxia mediterranea]
MARIRSSERTAIHVTLFSFLFHVAMIHITLMDTKKHFCYILLGLGYFGHDFGSISFLCCMFCIVNLADLMTYGELWCSLPRVDG